MFPALLGLSATQVNIWVTNIMASGLPEGSITALRFANRLIQLPIGIFAAGVAMAFFPLLSGLVTNKQIGAFKDTLALALRSIFFMMIPAAVGLIVLRYPIIKLLFEGQKFTSHDTQTTAFALLFYSMALFAHAAILMLPRAFYALQDTVTPVVISISSVLLSILINWLFLKYTTLGVGGFALSFSIMGLINMLGLMEVLRRKIGGIRGKGILSAFIKTSTAALTMGIVIIIVKNQLLVPMGRSLQLQGHLEAALDSRRGDVAGCGRLSVGSVVIKNGRIKYGIEVG